jgi:hypothetical protein
MVQRKRLIVCDARLRGILVIEAEGETVADDEPVSSSRLRKAEPAVVPEFDQLRLWRENALRARRAG